ncbi:hypothetical protein OB920_16290 [Halobacteria archaeon HArc-gm2]|nr:hypothetical protein [Halobacteria archaeon HArc-gm2]
MSQSRESTAAGPGESVYREYIRDVRIVEYTTGETSPGAESDETRYRFEAPLHTEVTFEDPDLAGLYADVYFDVNGFREEGTGDVGVPPEVVQAGKDTLAAYLLTQPHTTKEWVASFYGTTHPKIDRYVRWVSDRAEEIRATARERGVE